MLIQALTDHFQSYFNRAKHHDTVLWLDPGEEYAALLDHLTDVPLWRYQGSLLELRYRLIQCAPGERAVVYLPLRQEDAEVLHPFFATSLIFRDRLYRFLRRQGLDFPDDPQVAHEMRELLPRLAARSIGKGRAFWEYNLANLERARETLLGNFDDALLRFLAQPQATLSELKREKLEGLFFAQLESAYGLAAAPEDDPGDVARRLTAQLALVRAFTGAGQPHDFPYTAQLPAPLYFERCQAFLDRWQRDSAYKTAYIRLADGLEKRYNLAGWAAGLPVSVGLELGATFADVETALRDKVEAAMAGLESEADWRAWLGEYKAQFKIRAGSFWAQEGRAPGWGLLARAADLLAAVQGAREELDRTGQQAKWPDSVWSDRATGDYLAFFEFEGCTSNADLANQLLVEVLDSPAGEAAGTAPLPPYNAASLEPGAVTDLRALGEVIGEALLPGDVRLRYEASLSVVNNAGEGLRVRLRVHGEAVAAIPWEAARVGQEYLSLRPRTPLVRYVLAPQAPAPLAVHSPLQVLGIISHPTDLEPLDVEGERMRLEGALAPLIERRLVGLEWLPRADAQLLQDALRHGPHVIHYIGHGSYNEGRGEGVLWFTDAEGRGKLLPADWLATLLRDSTVRFAFLNACESGRAAGGLAEVLVRRGLPAALGTQSLLFDDAAIAFAAGFYRALSDGWPVDTAMVEGRKAIVNALGNDPDQPDWAQPVLYMRAPDGRLFEPPGRSPATSWTMATP